MANERREGMSIALLCTAFALLGAMVMLGITEML